MRRVVRESSSYLGRNSSGRFDEEEDTAPVAALPEAESDDVDMDVDFSLDDDLDVFDMDLGDDIGSIDLDDEQPEEEE